MTSSAPPPTAVAAADDQNRDLALLSLGTTVAVHETAAFELSHCEFEADEIAALATLPLKAQITIKARLVEVGSALREASRQLDGWLLQITEGDPVLP